AEVMAQWISSGQWDIFYLLISGKVMPDGLKWSGDILKNWEKSLNFGKFSHIGRDILLEINPPARKRQ
ncbi:hypothetical protein ACFL5V_12650, partial [Fibrobacterota bacterium]